MYIPKYFQVTDPDEIWDFVEKNGFGTIVTAKQGRPIATHVPLQVRREGEACYITGHLAYGNPQWRSLDACEDVLVMFQGPHAYISSSWYKQENVPTWNYQAVHLYGTSRILEAEELKQDISRLLQKYEGHRPNPVLSERLSPEFFEKQLKGIVGFQIQVQEVQAAYKLSQNRNAEDYLNIVNKLHQEQDLNSQEMAQAMERKRKANNEG